MWREILKILRVTVVRLDLFCCHVGFKLQRLASISWFKFLINLHAYTAIAIFALFCSRFSFYVIQLIFEESTGILTLIVLVYQLAPLKKYCLLIYCKRKIIFDLVYQLALLSFVVYQLTLPLVLFACLKSYDMFVNLLWEKILLNDWHIRLRNSSGRSQRKHYITVPIHGYNWYVAV